MYACMYSVKLSDQSTWRC